jgi:uncharacterized protein (TIGR01244 family)
MMKSTLSAAALLFALGCSRGADQPSASAGPSSGTADPTGGSAAAAPLDPAIAALGIPNARQPSPDLLTGGQISEQQMRELHGLGYRTFVNLRPADEPGTGWEEAYAQAEGIDFHRLPVSGAGAVNRRNAERLAGLLEGAGDGPAMIYCASGNRVGALLALKAHYLDGLDPDAAVAFGVSAGMTRLEPLVRGRMSAEQPIDPKLRRRAGSADPD